MCGIVGIVTNRSDENLYILTLKMLKRLEYRGYDSVGIALLDTDLKTTVHKKVGEVDGLLNEKFAQDERHKISISHTRWATHGSVSTVNTHPQTYQNVSIVHNGVIENYASIKESLRQKGAIFKSETDSEVIAALFYFELQESEDLNSAFKNTIMKLKGSFAILLTIQGYDFIGIARLNSPLIIAKNNDGKYFVTSDQLALNAGEYEIHYLNDNEIITIKDNQIDFTNHFQQWVKTSLSNSDIPDLIGYSTYMEKEIQEQSYVIGDIINYHVNFLKNKINFKEIDGLNIQPIRNIIFIACGSSYYASMVASRYFQEYANIRTYSEFASEFRYKTFHLDHRHDLFVLISQSGETADVLHCAKYLKEKGCNTLCITNVKNSGITRICDYTILCNAGAEISVASTKSVTAQIVILMLLAVRFGRKKLFLSSKAQAEIIENLTKISYFAKNAIQIGNQISDNTIEKIAKFSHIMYLGKDSYYAIALEGSLKMRELSYINSTAIPSGELKHGTISLASEDLLVIANCPNDHLFDKNTLAIESLVARNANVFLITSNSGGNFLQSQTRDKLMDIIDLPTDNPYATEFMFIIINQIIAYKTAKFLKRNVDKPRNLAKSVTVE